VRRPIALLPLALLLAGCGQAATTTSAEDFRGQERAVAQVVEDLQQAGEDDDAARICRDLIVQDLARQLDGAGSSCTEEIERSIEDVDDYELVVRDVTVSGDTAQATVEAGDAEDGRTTLRFAREGGAWRAAELPGS